VVAYRGRGQFESAELLFQSEEVCVSEGSVGVLEEGEDAEEGVEGLLEGEFALLAVDVHRTAAEQGQMRFLVDHAATLQRCQLVN
jgi:hypothetical protein